MSKYRRIARRLWPPLVVVVVLLAAGCGQSSVSQSGPDPASVDTTVIAVEATTTPAPRASSTTTPGAVIEPPSPTSLAGPSGRTFEAVILGSARDIGRSCA
jgi:hypothetical protein